MTAAGQRVDVPGADRAGVLGMVVALEMQARQQETTEALRFFAVNETRKVAAYRQAFLFEADGGPATIRAVSSLSMVERDAPMVRGFEAILTRFLAKEDASSRKPRYFLLDAFAGDDGAAREYPFRHLCWVPMPRRSGISGGLLLAREMPWRAPDMAVLEALADAYGHAFDALRGRSGWWPPGRRRVRRRALGFAAVAVVLAGFIPVSLTALAPAEVIAANPAIVTAPVDGVIAELPVEPNSKVGETDIVLSFVDTKLRNDAEIAARNVTVADTKYRKAVQGAFGSARENRDVAVAQAALEVRKAEAVFAHDMLARATVRAGRAGLLLYSSKSDWIGRPVSTGERIMEIADPRDVEVRIDLPITDVVTATENGRAVVYLDSDPLHPIETVLYRVAYQASVTGDGQHAFRLFARVKGDRGTEPRIGTRGTAQVYGQRVSLFFYLFRRPITAARQKLGV